MLRNLKVAQMKSAINARKIKTSTALKIALSDNKSKYYQAKISIENTPFAPLFRVGLEST